MGQTWGGRKTGLPQGFPLLPLFPEIAATRPASPALQPVLFLLEQPPGPLFCPPCDGPPAWLAGRADP